MTSITDLPNEMIREIIIRSENLDRLYLREVCYTWNQLTNKQLPPALLQTLRELTSLGADVDKLEKDIDILTDKISRLTVVQDNMETLSTAANVAAVGAAVIHGVPVIVKATQEHNRICDEHIREYREQYPDEDLACIIL